MELGSSEWKKKNISPSVGRQQQIKNVRINKTILRALERMPVDDDERCQLFVLGMDWIGKIQYSKVYGDGVELTCHIGPLGYLFAVKQYDSAYIAHFMGDLVLPATIGNLVDFKKTLDLLFAYKYHHIRLARIMEPAYYRRNAELVLHSCRYPATPKRDLSPDTLFTPVKRKCNKKFLQDMDRLLAFWNQVR